MKQTNTAKIQSKISPEQQIMSMLIRGDNRNFCHIKANQREERSCVSQHSLSLCIMKKNFCFHRQTEMLLESLAPLSSEDKELPVHTELTITAPLPWMEMDLDSVTFSMVRQQCSACALL